MTTSSGAQVSCEKRGHIMLIGIDRVAKRNAFDLELLNAFCLAYGEYERDREARVALVFAHGEHFTAGLDLVAAGWTIPAGGCDPWGVFGGPRVSKPVVIAAQGYCYTIGIELMLASDINLCASNTRFAQMEVQRGIFPFGGATLRMHQNAGWGNAMRWLLTGDEFDAHEAYRLGLVQEVVASEDLMPRALWLAERIAAQAPLRCAGNPGVRAPSGRTRRSRSRRRPASDRRAPDDQRGCPGRRARHAGTPAGRFQRAVNADGRVAWRGALARELCCDKPGGCLGNPDAIRGKMVRLIPLPRFRPSYEIVFNAPPFYQEGQRR